MDMQRVDMYIMTNQKYFPAEKLPFLRDRLLNCDYQRFMMISTMELKDPTTALLLSIFLGGLGVDRFVLGDVGIGVGKLLTCGGCGVWTIVDWFLVMNRAKDVNFEKIMTML